MTSDPQRFARIKDLLLRAREHPADAHVVVEQTTAGEVVLDAGNLYRSMRRLLAQGLIERLEPDEVQQQTDDRRRYYRLTNLGLDATRADVLRMRSLMQSDRIERLLDSSAC